MLAAGDRLLARFAVVLVALVAACSSSDDPPPPAAPTPAGALVGPGGGNVVSNDGLATLMIPAGALTEEVFITVTVQPVAQLAGNTSETRHVYEIAPEDLEFNEDATMRWLFPSVPETEFLETHIVTTVVSPNTTHTIDLVAMTQTIVGQGIPGGGTVSLTSLVDFVVREGEICCTASDGAFSLNWMHDGVDRGTLSGATELCAPINQETGSGSGTFNSSALQYNFLTGLQPPLNIMAVATVALTDKTGLAAVVLDEAGFIRISDSIPGIDAVNRIFADGDGLVAVESVDESFNTGYTFYEQYTESIHAVDNREPLSTTWAARYLNGGALGGLQGNGPSSYFAYVRNNAGTEEVRNVWSDGTNDVLLRGSFDTVISLKWAPDGSRLAFFVSAPGAGEIYTVAPDGTGLVMVASMAQLINYEWSPNSGTIAYETFNDLFTVNVDGTNQQQVSTETVGDASFAWAPNSRVLAYIGEQTNELYAVESSGVNHIRVSMDGEVARDFAWAPDGSLLAYSAGFVAIELFAVERDGTNRRDISGSIVKGASGLEEAEDFHWAPDSSRIAYRARQGSISCELYTTLADGTDNVRLSRPITSFGGVQRDFAWLPDSTTVIYRADPTTTDAYELFAALADGTDETRISRDLVNGDFVDRFSVDNRVYCPDLNTINRRIMYVMNQGPVTMVLGTMGTDPACPGQPFAGKGCGFLEQFSAEVATVSQFIFTPVGNCVE